MAIGGKFKKIFSLSRPRLNYLLCWWRKRKRTGINNEMVANNQVKQINWRLSSVLAAETEQPQKIIEIKGRDQEKNFWQACCRKLITRSQTQEQNRQPVTRMYLFLSIPLDQDTILFLWISSPINQFHRIVGVSSKNFSLYRDHLIQYPCVGSERPVGWPKINVVQRSCRKLLVNEIRENFIQIQKTITRTQAGRGYKVGINFFCFQKFFSLSRPRHNYLLCWWRNRRINCQ